MQGCDDQTVPLSHSERCHARLPQRQLFVIEGGNYAILCSGATLLAHWLEHSANAP